LKQKGRGAGAEIDMKRRAVESEGADGVETDFGVNIKIHAAGGSLA